MKIKTIYKTNFPTGLIVASVGSMAEEVCDSKVAKTIARCFYDGMRGPLLESARKTRVIAEYIVDPQKPASRGVDRVALQKYASLLQRLLPHCPLKKQQIYAGMVQYNKDMGMIFGTPSNTMNDQAWAVKRLTMDIDSIKKNCTTGSRLPSWLKDLVNLWPEGALDDPDSARATEDLF